MLKSVQRERKIQRQLAEQQKAQRPTEAVAAEGAKVNSRHGMTGTRGPDDINQDDESPEG